MVDRFEDVLVDRFNIMMPNKMLPVTTNNVRAIDGKNMQLHNDNHFHYSGAKRTISDLLSPNHYKIYCSEIHRTSAQFNYFLALAHSWQQTNSMEPEYVNNRHVCFFLAMHVACAVGRRICLDLYRATAAD